MRRRVLMIANDFPPVGGAGVQRSLYFAKYLPRFGWMPTVLTVKEVAFPTKDASLLDELPPEARVVRTESFELRRLLWRWHRLRGRSVARNGPTGKRSAVSSERDGARARELGRSLKRWLFVPDDRVLWAPFAVTRAVKLFRKTRFQAIYATTPCYSAGLIGYLVSLLTGVPLVLDLRDPWSRDPYLPSPTSIHAWLNAKIERVVIRKAERVVVISETMRARFAATYHDLPEDRFRVITNGFDAEAGAAVQPEDSEGRFAMAYVGSLYAHHREAFRAFCRAWARAAEANPAFTERSVVWLVGRCDPEIREELGQWPAVPAEILGYRPHEQGLARLKGASGLLLLIKDLDPESDLVTIPGKLFEYLASGSPILMIGPEGDAAEIVRENGGHVHRQSDVDGIAASLGRLLSRSIDDRMAGGGAMERSVSAYDRKTLTGKLALELDAITENR